MRCIRLNKTVMRLTPKASQFLMDYSANTPEAPQNAFVDLKGKIVATFEQMRLDEDNSILVIETPFIQRVQKHLEKYISLCDTRLSVVPDQVYFDLEGRYQPQEGEYVLPLHDGTLVITSRSMDTNVSEDEFRLYRLRHHMPLQGTDYDDVMLLNVDEKRFASFTKGCYLGQEIIARVHHRGKPPQRLVVQNAEAIDEELQGNMTSQCPDPESGRILGFMFVEHE